MKVDTIITLDNDKEYALLEKLDFEGKVYFFAAGIDKDEEATGEYVFIEQIMKNNKTYIQKVLDKKLLGKLSTIVTKEYFEAVESLTKDNE